MNKERKTLVKGQRPVSSGQLISRQRKKGLVIDAIQKKMNRVV